MAKIKKIDIDKLSCPDGKNLVYLWDSTLPGFGVRCTSRGVKSFVLSYRINSKKKIKTLYRTDLVDLTEARDEARTRLAVAAGNKDPFSSEFEKMKTVKDLAEDFQKNGPDIKDKTKKSYSSLWKHIVKHLGNENLDQIGDDQIKLLRIALKDKETTFNRCISLLCTSLKWKRLLTENHPLKYAKKFREKKKQRILSKAENAHFYKQLGEYKRERKTGWRYADLFILLLLTGLRLDEWRVGRWEWIDWAESMYRLPDNKTGGRDVYLSSHAIDVLKRLAEEQDNPQKGYIFPSPSNEKKAISWTWRVWNQMRNEMGLQDFRIHDMRHTAGSFAHKFGGLSQRQVADYLGHSRLETSSRYIHDDEKQSGAEAASQAIAESWKD